MKILAVNGSPRKNWNTATLLNKALEGAASRGAETELIHLHDLNYKGCISCFACKTKGGQSYGKCPIQDDLPPIFKKVEEADAIILGSPIYFGRVTGEMASFLDRLLFQYCVYSNSPQSLFPKKINSGFIYTMNVTEEEIKGYFDQHLIFNEKVLRRVFGESETLSSFDTYQFEDYSKVVVTRFDPEKKAKRRKEVFPIDCSKAFDMGARFAGASPAQI
ncbi:MAG TPA: flavodoxin family protein [Methylomusa anaerophila]|uniref:2-amino-4-deoxychorismate dehydrogenase n=1 Tax=Methylomusa anaerophila TaxID=1930071 RepID=A0A348AII4_9FIRM|nr:flavodoxin family protein [Methylomusa anaerophila]BBB90882.1 2-amino-4-deoxychorismate dehydrogenase [Methylomusa anaerophila]HML90601.1 flavodoxin family protein [Methylomusa anaerophila]